eukprot:g13758.t1
MRTYSGVNFRPFLLSLVLAFLALAGFLTFGKAPERSSLRASMVLAADWTQHEGMNCFQGHGGIQLADGYELPGFLLDDCKAQCEKVSGCAGVVVGQGSCWRLSSLTPSERHPGARRPGRGPRPPVHSGRGRDPHGP